MSHLQQWKCAAFSTSRMHKDCGLFPGQHGLKAVLFVRKHTFATCKLCQAYTQSFRFVSGTHLTCGTGVMESKGRASPCSSLATAPPGLRQAAAVMSTAVTLPVFLPAMGCLLSRGCLYCRMSPMKLSLSLLYKRLPDKSDEPQVEDRASVSAPAPAPAPGVPCPAGWAGRRLEMNADMADTVG